MTSGPTIIRKCSSCSKMIQQRTLASGNSFGAIYWTDGKCEAPMLPAQKRLVVCASCQAILWIDQLEILGEVDSYVFADSEFKEALEYNDPTIDEYIRAFGRGVVPPEEEHYVRINAWWDGNDSRRWAEKDHPLSSLEISNLTAFVKLLDESDRNGLVTKSEVLRELGRFDEAIVLLDHAASSKLTPAVATILGLAKLGDPFVRRLYL